MRRELPTGQAALTAGAAAAWAAVGSSNESAPVIAAVLALVVGWSYIGSGLAAWRHRPENRLGPTMLFIGFAWFATFLADVDESLAFTVGTFVESLYLAGFVYLVLAFPSGRLRTPVDRFLVAAAVFLTTLVEAAWMVFADSRKTICAGCPANAFQVVRHDVLAEGILEAQRAVGVVLCAFTVILLVQRWRRAAVAERRAVAPVLWAASATFTALGFSVSNDIAHRPLGAVPEWTLSCVFASIPLAVAAVLLQRRLAHAGVARLVVELRTGATTDLRLALAQALGDPSLELAYWLPSRGRYVTADGLPLRLPDEESPRAVTAIERDGEPVAALVHDEALRENPELVESVCAAASLSVENERLRAELLARLAELQESRARLVEATESERRRIERDLHDVTQQRLVSIAMTLGLAESKLEAEPATVGVVLREARDALTLALDELRELSHGIRPAVLAERGLAAALDDLARRAALPVHQDVTLTERLAEHVEATGYSVASEALTNAAKHSHAREVRLTAACDGENLVVEVADDGIGGAGAGGGGSGLRGLTDRVEALGGRLTVTSPPGRGTIVRASLPCA